MENEPTSGRCRLCDRIFGKRQMAAHLKACWKKHAMVAPSQKGQGWFHLVVDARYSRDYWLHLQAPADGTFGALDRLLRAVWLECCDHMSDFEFSEKRRRHGGLGNLSALLTLLDESRNPMMGEDDDALMEQLLGSKLQPGVVFSHKYDYGTTTELALRVAGQYSAPALAGAFKILARNDPPEILCSVCGKPATQLCQECGGAELCNTCGRRHACGPEMLAPLINSPRTGVCGYCGPSREP